MGYHPRAWRILPNGFDLEVYKPDAAARLDVRKALDIPSDAPLIGIVGRFHPMKDHACFLKAAEILHSRRSIVHFIMVGDGLSPENYELKNAAQRLFSSGRLHLMGARQDVPRFLAAMDIFSLTSHGGEGFPNVVGEAMACGLPCVVTETAGDSPMIVGESGLVVPSGNPEALAEAWERLLDMPDTDRQALGSSARERVRRNYSIASIVALYEKLYINIAGSSQD
jgi:glycosyltransferase involved in cell wall biosynthesis